MKWGIFGATERGEVEVAVLMVDGVQIPYEYRVDEGRGERTLWRELQLGAFGHSIAGLDQDGLMQHDWSSDAERAAGL